MFTFKYVNTCTFVLANNCLLLILTLEKLKSCQLLSLFKFKIVLFFIESLESVRSWAQTIPCNEGIVSPFKKQQITAEGGGRGERLCSTHDVSLTDPVRCHNSAMPLTNYPLAFLHFLSGQE